MRELPSDHVGVRRGLALHGPNAWPHYPSQFRPLFEQYVNAMLALGAQIMSAMAIGLGLHANYFVPLMNPSFWVARAISYPSLRNPSESAINSNVKDGKASIGCGEHTDYGCLTIVNQDNDHMHSLQVQRRDGSWIDADPIPHAFVVNIGDVVEVWTGGLYRSTPHRVLSPTGLPQSVASPRLSIPFFYEPRFDAQIRPLPLTQSVSGDDIRIPNGYQKQFLYGQHLVNKVYSNFTFADGTKEIPKIPRNPYSADTLTTSSIL